MVSKARFLPKFACIDPFMILLREQERRMQKTAGPQDFFWERGLHKIPFTS